VIPSLFPSHGPQNMTRDSCPPYKSPLEGHTLLNQNNLHQHTRILSIHKTKITSLTQKVLSVTIFIFLKGDFARKTFLEKQNSTMNQNQQKSSLLPTKTFLIWKTFHLLVKTFLE